MGDATEPGGGAPAEWGALWTKLQSRQSLSAVVNTLAASGGSSGGRGLEALEKWAEAQGEVEQIPEVPLGPVPEAADFQPYLDTFEKEWKVYHRSRLSRLSAPSRRDVGEVSCPGVPTEYFKRSFRLANHQLFENVRDTIEFHDERDEELRSQLDAVEVALFQAVQKAHHERFIDDAANMGASLSEEVTSALGAVRTLRGRLRSVQEGQLRHSAAAVRLVRRRARVAEVLRLVQQLAGMEGLAQEVELLLQRRAYSDAFDLLERSSAALGGELSGFAGMEAWHVRLGRLGRGVDLAAQADFVDRFAVVVLGARGAAVDAADAELRSLSSCLRLRGSLPSLIPSVLRDKLLTDLKPFLRVQARRILAEQTPGAASPRNSGSGDSGTADISAALTVISHSGFLSFWGEVLRACMDVVGGFCESAQLVAHEGGVPEEMASLLGELTDLLLAKAGAFLMARQKQHQMLGVQEWQELSSLTANALGAVAAQQRMCDERLWEFVESQSKDTPAPARPARDPGFQLRSIMDSQTGLVVESFHGQCMAQVKSGLEQERWERSDVPVACQQTLDSLLSRGGAPAATPGGAAQEPARYLQVGAAKFLAIPSLLALLQLLATYSQLSLEWGSCSVHIVWHMHHLLRHFSQLSRALVLGGQAVQHGMLRKINATHLSLCFQSLSLLEQVLPRLPEFLQSVLQGRGDQSAAKAYFDLAAESSKLAAELAEHRGALLEKLSELLRERCEFHIQTWLGSPHPEAPELQQESTGIDAGPSISSTPHPAAEGLAKDVTAMYSVLVKSLGADPVHRIFAKAFVDVAARFEHRLACGALTALPKPYAGGAGCSLGDRLAADLAYLHDQLGKLDRISTPLQNLLSDLARHLQMKLPTDDPLRRLHRPILDALRSAGRLPPQ